MVQNITINSELNSSMILIQYFVLFTASAAEFKRPKSPEISYIYPEIKSKNDSSLIRLLIAFSFCIKHFVIKHIKDKANSCELQTKTKIEINSFLCVSQYKPEVFNDLCFDFVIPKFLN